MQASIAVNTETPVPPIIEHIGGAIVIAAIVVAVVVYMVGSRRSAKKYAALSALLDRQFGNQRESDLSPGHTYAVASRGPSHARDAEMQSAETRWRHLSMAFPHLDDRGKKRPLVLVSRSYTTIAQVETMQNSLAALVQNHAQEQNRRVLKPAWIQELGEDFDALRHPQLAIANPAIYTFPFFLTWQRRHQWGVLPYAVHNRLGVICHPKHSQSKALRETQEAYNEDLKRAKSDLTALWVNDPKHARWLTLLLTAAGTTPIDINRKPGSLSLAQQHTSGTLFSVGAYLHKEILPLMCSVIPDPEVGSVYAEYARELEVSDLKDGLLPANLDDWPIESAVIADLAVLPSTLESAGWSVFRLPHCVYVPIGIGYSVGAVPLLLEHSSWRNRLLWEAGEMLVNAETELANLGIELDKRLWTADRLDGR